jgi:hypothetical protein
MTWYPRVRVRIRTLLLALAVMSLLSFPLGIAGVQAQDPPPRTFPETGRSLQGIFLEYWESHGGLAQQGYPISDEIFETSPLDGKRHKVQYFERAVFERHSENNPPYDVLLVQLGTFRYKELYGEQGAQGQRANPAGRLFPETGFHLGGIFLDYWEKHGGLPQLGYPISDEFDEKSDLDGKTYRVQYFERAVMEHHPENKAPYDVLLSQLGTFRYRHEYPTDKEPAATPAAAPSTPIPTPAGIEPTATTSAPVPPATVTPDAGYCAEVSEARKSSIGSTGPVAIANVHYAGQEYVEVRNNGTEPADIGDWTLRDKNTTRQRFDFAPGTMVGPSETIQIYTEPGHPYSFNSGSAIWNNCGDALELLDANGQLAATYAYGNHLLK